MRKLPGDALHTARRRQGRGQSNLAAWEEAGDQARVAERLTRAAPRSSAFLPGAGVTGSLGWITGSTGFLGMCLGVSQGWLLDGA